MFSTSSKFPKFIASRTPCRYTHLAIQISALTSSYLQYRMEPQDQNAASIGKVAKLLNLADFFNFPFISGYFGIKFVILCTYSS